MTIYDWLERYDIHPAHHQLIDDAFIHSSYVNEHRKVLHDNERLEFIGDAVMQIWVSERLFRMQPELSEGQMTSLRQKTVCEATFAQVMRHLQLEQFIKLGAGEEKNGGRNRDSILADAFEAFVGALYLTLGMEAVDRILDPVFDEYLKHPEETGVVDYKTQLQEYVQSDIRKAVSYRLLKETGPSNNPTFTMGVYLDDILLGTGTGSNKKSAEQAAARQALEKMVKL